ncbi:MBL fold metallo-hydrolase [Streptomyces sp. LHD-70]|uniref:MBL fold metallo-hydrolase n=1 Tax=Streptomyces sp. LHD-70 TaxID=3072140 RepID=UPI00280EB4B5|nr:MBL fold metallo-hydrolase [Streptomyces sp. LHD-70]MDQ8705560.1 MBL fold metallo-hydrolase [Streptomyces sp. LHD-70]
MTLDHRRSLNRRTVLGGTAAATSAALLPTLTATPAAASRRPRPAPANRLVLLGTAGGPPPEPGRAGIASALVVDGRVHLVDAGRGAVTQYLAAGLRYRDLAAVHVTHLHADHIADLHNFFLLPGFGANDSGDGITRPVDVHGPGPAGALPPVYGGGTAPTVAPDRPTPGLADLLDRQIEAFAYSTNVFLRDSGIRDVRELIRVHETAAPDVGADPLGPTAPDMEPFTVTDDGSVKVTAVLVPHGPVFPSYAYRFDTPYGSVVFSGDTAPSDNLVRLARGADILVHEVIDLDFYDGQGLDDALLDHLRVSHTDVTEVGPLAERAGVGTLVLSHIVPADPALVGRGSWARRAGQGFGGRVVVGEDLLSLPLHGLPHPAASPTARNEDAR